MLVNLADAQPPRGGTGQGQRGERPQGPGIVGKIMDENDLPIPYANVAVYDVTGENIIGGSSSNDEGRFMLPLKSGDYMVKISFLSYEEKTIEGVKVGTEITRLGKIILREKGTDLGEVVVQAEKSQLQLQLDKRVFVVGTDLSNTGSNASELLENVPSLSVDIDGNVSLRGSENVRILIDGKPSGLIGGGSHDALRSLQSSNIEKVEVITNPSAKYDAEGEVGIVNLVLKKEKKKGVNGSIDLSAGWPASFGAGLNLNIRKEKFNLFTNVGMNYRKSPGRGTTYQEFYPTPTTKEIYESESTRERGGYSGTMQLGVDYFVNELNTITVSGLYKISRGRNFAEVKYKDFDEDKTLLNETVRTDNEKEPSQDFEAAINHTKKFAQKGRKWTSDFKYLIKDDTEQNKYKNTFTDGRADLQQRADNVEDEQTYLIQTDYIHPFSKVHKFEVGLKGTFRNIQNEYVVEQLNGNSWEVLAGFDDALTYTENIYAAYAIYGNKWKKLSYQLGIRSEYSDIKTALKKSGVSNPRDYLDFFPSAHFSYEVNEKNQFQLSYSRRLTRPRFWFLLPFVTFSDTRQRWQGNPDLNPEYTNSVELGYLRYFENGSLLSSVYYRYRTGVIQRLRIPDTNGNVDMFPVNLSTQNAFGIELSGNYTITKWWSATASVDFYQAVTEGSYENIRYDVSTTTMQGRFSSKFKLPKKIQLQTAFMYRAPRRSAQGKNLAMYGWDLGASVDVLKGKGTLTLSGRDLLNTRKRRSIIDTEQLYSTGTYQRRARMVTIGFNYRINQEKKRGRGGRPTGGGDDF